MRRLKEKILPQLGIEPERLEFFNLSSAEGPRWAEICNQFTETVRELGPSPVSAAIARRANRKEGRR